MCLKRWLGFSLIVIYSKGNELFGGMINGIYSTNINGTDKKYLVGGGARTCDDPHDSGCNTLPTQPRPRQNWQQYPAISKLINRFKLTITIEIGVKEFSTVL